VSLVVRLHDGARAVVDRTVNVAADFLGERRGHRQRDQQPRAGQTDRQRGRNPVPESYPELRAGRTRNWGFGNGLGVSLFCFWSQHASSPIDTKARSGRLMRRWVELEGRLA